MSNCRSIQKYKTNFTKYKSIRHRLSAPLISTKQHKSSWGYL